MKASQDFRTKSFFVYKLWLFALLSTVDERNAGPVALYIPGGAGFLPSTVSQLQQVTLLLAPENQCWKMNFPFEWGIRPIFQGIKY